MTNEQKTKLKVLTDFLKTERIYYCREYVNKSRNVVADVYIPANRIAIKVSQGKEKDDEFYKKVKYIWHPLFIRDNESEDFVLEKLQNLIIDIMKQSQKNYIKKNRA